MRITVTSQFCSSIYSSRVFVTAAFSTTYISHTVNFYSFIVSLTNTHAFFALSLSLCLCNTIYILYISLSSNIFTREQLLTWLNILFVCYYCYWCCWSVFFFLFYFGSQQVKNILIRRTCRKPKTIKKKQLHNIHSSILCICF